MAKLPPIIFIDTLHPQPGQAWPQSLSVALGDRPTDRRTDEQILVVMKDPTPGQALRHVCASLALFARAVLKAIDAYMCRIDRGYMRTHYTFRGRIIDG